MLSFFFSLVSQQPPVTPSLFLSRAVDLLGVAAGEHGLGRRGRINSMENWIIRPSGSRATPSTRRMSTTSSTTRSYFLASRGQGNGGVEPGPQHGRRSAHSSGGAGLLFLLKNLFNL